MYKQVFFLLILLSGGSLFGQELNTVEFKYDEAGNRILQHAIYVPETKVMDSYTDSTYYDNPKVSLSLSDRQVSVFPNPTLGKFKVTIDNIDDSDIISYSLISLSGQVLKTGSFIQSSMEFDLEHQNKGPYIFSISINGFRKTWTIIRQ